MPRPSKPLFLTFAIAFVVLLTPVCMLMSAGGALRSVEPAFAGSCEAVPLPGGARDIQVDRERGVAYLSVRDRDTGNGTVMLLDLNLANPAPRAAMSHDPQGFRPSGISLLKRAGQPTRLFAVSESDRVPAVEVAEQDAGGAFVPVESVRDPAFGSARLVAAAGTEEFYVVDHRPAATGLRQKLALLTRSGDDTITYRDRSGSVVVAEGLAWVSGLALSADGTHLYVAEMLTRSLRIYRRVAGKPDLALERTVSLDSPPGSVSLDADGVIWLTAHPKLLRYFAALHGAPEPSPTQLLRLDANLPAAKAVQVFADDGAKISAGSSIARWRGELLIGSSLDNKVLICKTAP